MKTPALLSAALLLLVVSGAPDARSGELETSGHHKNLGYGRFPVTVRVVSYEGTKTYNTYVVKGGIILGALKRLNSTTSFRFAFREDPDFGPVITHVNSLFESPRHVWKVLLKGADGNDRVVTGCFQAQRNDIISLVFWPRNPRMEAELDFSSYIS